MPTRICRTSPSSFKMASLTPKEGFWYIYVSFGRAVTSCLSTKGSYSKDVVSSSHLLCDERSLVIFTAVIRVLSTQKLVHTRPCTGQASITTIPILLAYMWIARESYPRYLKSRKYSMLEHHVRSNFFYVSGFLCRTPIPCGCGSIFIWSWVFDLGTMVIAKKVISSLCTVFMTLGTPDTIRDHSLCCIHSKTF